MTRLTKSVLNLPAILLLDCHTMILSVRARIWTYWETRTDEPCSFCLVFFCARYLYIVRKLQKKYKTKKKKEKCFVITLDLSLVLSVYLILV